MLPAVVGLGALLAGFVLLQFGMFTKAPASSGTTQLAAARGGDHTASRGSRRTPVDPASSQIAALAAAGSLVSPADEPDPTTTTAAPTTTTTTAPPPSTTTTTRPPTTTTTAAPAPRPPAAPRPSAPDPGPVGDDVWKKLAQCEAGGRNDTGAPYYGYFQFSAGTWAGLGGTGLPSDHTYDEQKAMAQKLQARSGWGQWPVCSRNIGAS